MPATIAPYGTWKSPITADLIAGGAIGLVGVRFAGDTVVWTEMRPTEGGRTALVRSRPGGGGEDVLPPPWSLRSRVHEYGGGAFVTAGHDIFLSADADRRLYQLSLDGGEPRAITADGPWRYADPCVDRARRRLVCVREDHSRGGPDPANALVAVDLEGGNAGHVLVEGDDFYAAPRLDPSDERLAWLSWRHPHMPWNETELWVGTFDASGELVDRQRVAGGNGESIFQPEWSHDGVLHFVSDRTGWWNLYRFEGGQSRALHPIDAELGLPQWGLGMSTYGFADARTIVCAYGRGGVTTLARLDVPSGAMTDIPTPFVSVDGVHVQGDRVVFIGGLRDAASCVIELDLATGNQRVLRKAFELDLDPGLVSIAEAIEFPTGEGRSAYGFYYPPANPDFVAPTAELPPLRVRSHGGPTAATDPSFKLGIQYWTSRGFAVLDVNYGGSTGYGRAYRDRLAGQWGVVDVDDCVNGARFLVAEGRVDQTRLTISGGSAGGYTTLCALTFHDVFRAGASHYGIGDLAALTRDTHKFESRYTDWLVAPYPEGAEIYRARSPLAHCDRLSCPVIFFQGLEDRVVPPNQAEEMVEALRAKGLPVALVTFPDEGHGFRKAENIKRALEAELEFFARIFGFTPADGISPVAIENWPPR